MVTPFSSNGHVPDATLADLDMGDFFGHRVGSARNADPTGVPGFHFLGQIDGVADLLGLSNLDQDDPDELDDQMFRSMLESVSEPVLELSMTNVSCDDGNLSIVTTFVTVLRCINCGGVHGITVDVTESRSCPIHGMHTSEVGAVIDPQLIKAVIEEAIVDVGMLNGYVPAELFEAISLL